jgi:hypothetical protein
VAPTLMARGEVPFLLRQRALAPIIGVAASPCAPTVAEAGTGSKTSADALGRGGTRRTVGHIGVARGGDFGRGTWQARSQDTSMCVRPREGAPAWEGAWWPRSRGWRRHAAQRAHARARSAFCPARRRVSALLVSVYPGLTSSNSKFLN